MSGQNVFGPAASPVFDPAPVRGVRRVKLPLEETLFSWPGFVIDWERSGLWVPPFDAILRQIVVTMRVPEWAYVEVNASNGMYVLSEWVEPVEVTVFDVDWKVPAGGWVRVEVVGGWDPTDAPRDLVVAVRHARSQVISPSLHAM